MSVLEYSTCESILLCAGYDESLHVLPSQLLLLLSGSYAFEMFYHFLLFFFPPLANLQPGKVRANK